MAIILLLFLALLFLIIYYTYREPCVPSGKYPRAGPWFSLKRFIYWMLIRYSPKKATSYGALRKKEKHGTNKMTSEGISTCDLEAPQRLVDNPYAIDSVYFTAFSKVEKSFIITRVARRTRKCSEVWLFMRVDGIGDFQHPEHPITLMASEENNSWNAGGLTMMCVKPYEEWRISFDGQLRKGPFQSVSKCDGGSVHVKFTLHWSATTDVFDFDYDFHPGTAAEAMALEPLTTEFLKSVKKAKDEHCRYEQWGSVLAEVSISDVESQMLLNGIRSHSYGVRNWMDFHRYIMFLMHFENGMCVHLNIVSLHKTTRHFIVGYVLFADGKKAGIEWSDAHLSNLADDHVIEEHYQIRFTAGGQMFEISATLDSKNSPLIYNPSLDTSSKSKAGITHECIATFRLGTGGRGWGLVEFFYGV